MLVKIHTLYGTESCQNEESNVSHHYNFDQDDKGPWLEERYVWRTCPESITNIIHEMYGGFEIFGRAKVIHTHAVWVHPKTGHLHSINSHD